ncbi:MAG: VOC family protein [Bacteroidota bacterium]
MNNLVKFTLAPWLSVRNSLKALDFYKIAFDAEIVYRMDTPDGVVARLSAYGAEFWLGEESPQHSNFSPETLKGCSVRLILTVPDPDAVFNKLIDIGAKQVYPVEEEYGWRIGRVEDPFGHHWEIGKPVED